MRHSVRVKGPLHTRLYAHLWKKPTEIYTCSEFKMVNVLSLDVFIWEENSNNFVTVCVLLTHSLHNTDMIY